MGQTAPFVCELEEDLKTKTRREKLAMDRIAAAEKAALTEVRQTAADVATRAAEQVLAQGLGDTDQVLIDHAIADLPRALRAA
jgi:F-type H+-transporting ATPase subunit b